VHLLPAERADARVIDEERVCQAIAALDGPEAIAARARQFAVLADPTRLTLLICIKDTTVSQTLRYLRATQTVTAERDGRVVRYRLAQTPIADLLAHTG
jgi:hypothetical protein